MHLIRARSHTHPYMRTPPLPFSTQVINDAYRMNLEPFTETFQNQDISPAIEKGTLRVIVEGGEQFCGMRSPEGYREQIRYSMASNAPPFFAYRTLIGLR